MVKRYDDDGCWVDDGALVTYFDYRELEVRHDVFLTGVRAALTELENSPEVNEQSRPDEVTAVNDAVEDTINLLMNALDKGRD